MNVIIFGTREIADLAFYYLTHDSIYKPVAFCEDAQYLGQSTCHGIPVIAFEEVQKEFPPEKCNFFLPLYDNFIREKKTVEAKAKGYNLISYISSKAFVATTDLGENCFIMENNVIQPFVKVGNNVVMWSGNHIGHHSRIGNHIFFSSHVVLSGQCIVEDYTWFGVNSTIRDGLNIAEGSFIGMASVITKSTKPYTKYFGNPAQVIGTVTKT